MKFNYKFLQKPYTSYYIAAVIIIILIILICRIHTIIICINHKANNYVTNRINKLNFINYTKFNMRYGIKQPNKIPIYIFYHIGINSLYGHTVDLSKAMCLINDQLNEIFYSGLYEKCDAIYYGCNGANSDTILKELFQDYKKIKPLEFGAIAPNEQTYENKTINAMIQFSKNATEPFYGLYIHTKGMTHPKNTTGEWRKHMEHWLIKKHSLCIDILNRGFNTVGTGLLIKHPLWTPTGQSNIMAKNKWIQSYCGNFYWFSSTYLKKCKLIDDLSYRFNAEFYLFKKYEKNKHVNLDTVRYCYLGGVSNQIFYKFPINKDIKIGIY